MNATATPPRVLTRGKYLIEIAADLDAGPNLRIFPQDDGTAKAYANLPGGEPAYALVEDRVALDLIAGLEKGGNPNPLLDRLLEWSYECGISEFGRGVERVITGGL